MPTDSAWSEDCGQRTTARGRAARRAARLRGWLDRLLAHDGEALGIWVLSRIAVFLAASMTGWLFFRLRARTIAAHGPRSTRTYVQPFLDRWAQWDFYPLPGARRGLVLQPADRRAARGVLPRLPVHAVGAPRTRPFGSLARPRRAVVSAVAGAVAVVALRRLGDLEVGPGAGNRAVLLLVLAPPAVFLAAPYTESLFLAFAIPAWLAARRGQWAMAGILCAGACTVRVTGLFLAVALVVEFLTSPKRDWRQVGWIAVAFSTTAAYMLWLWNKTGDPLRWLHAQEEGWQRTFTSPWTSLKHTIDGALNNGYPPDFGWQFRAEIIAAGDRRPAHDRPAGVAAVGRGDVRRAADRGVHDELLVLLRPALDAAVVPAVRRSGRHHAALAVDALDVPHRLRPAHDRLGRRLHLRRQVDRLVTGLKERRVTRRLVSSLLGPPGAGRSWGRAAGYDEVALGFSRASLMPQQGTSASVSARDDPSLRGALSPPVAYTPRRATPNLGSCSHRYRGRV